MLPFGVLKYNSLFGVFWIRYFKMFFICFDMMINITMRSLNNDQQQFCWFLLQHFTTLNTDRVRRLNGTSLLNTYNIINKGNAKAITLMKVSLQVSWNWIVAKRTSRIAYMTNLVSTYYCSTPNSLRQGKFAAQHCAMLCNFNILLITFANPCIIFY